MHVAVIVDAERLESEQGMLHRLVIGLAADGALVTRIVPEGADFAVAREEEISFAPRVEYSPKVVPWLRADRRRRLAERLERAVPDIVYALGFGAWDMASDLARELQRPLTLEVWRASLVRRTPRRAKGIPALGLLAPVEPLAAGLRARARGAAVDVVPYGVSVPDRSTPVFEHPADCMCFAVIGSMTDLRAHRSFVPAMVTIAERAPQLQFCVELDGPHGHDVWRMLRAQSMLPRVSAITRSHGNRALITQCDAVIMPERTGEVRSLLLEVMAAGVPIIAAEDPVLQGMLDDSTATLLDRPSADDWLQVMTSMVADPTPFRVKAAAARDRVESGHRSSRQADRLLRFFEPLTSGGTLKFVA